MNREFYYTIQPGDNLGLLAERFHTPAEQISKNNPGVDPYNLRVGQRLLIPMRQSAFRQDDCISQAEFEFRSDNRRLWEEHVAWTRMTIISLTFNLPDVEFVIARLLQNATDMGNAIRPCYGDRLADIYANLVKEHLLFAADIVKAAVAGDQQAAMAAEQKWYTNADEIARFWSSVNPYLSEKGVRDMFYQHLDLTKQEAIFMINMDYQKDIQIYDEIEEQALAMSDAISIAIVKQFPELFA
ncbi:LysM domain-containing protein [Virgibacillus subterraneus]|uniref:LysM domain-containing protein n=1 Tax=Virgibacillus subterraneus TaxID=621109 RepID=A0A1H8ZIZ5_9BACI|nr:LysM domain-containing protein [Virgibacillus subterraneus]SEP64529.1 LysM domain-containing protein [Virgibacillus subterraneus]